MNVYSLGGLVPVVDPTAFVHPQAVLIGDVIVAAHCYVGPGASLRGDFGRILRPCQPDLLAAGTPHGTAIRAQTSQINGIGR